MTLEEREKLLMIAEKRLRFEKRFNETEKITNVQHRIDMQRLIL